MARTRLPLPGAPTAPAAVSQPVNATAANNHPGHTPVKESDLSGGNDTSAPAPVNIGDPSMATPNFAPGHPNAPQGGDIVQPSIQPGPD